MENTVKDFLKMIVNHKVSAIVMLCELRESGKVDSIGINVVHYSVNTGGVLPVLGPWCTVQAVQC